MRRLALLAAGALVASALAWTSVGGLDSASGQSPTGSPSPGTQLRRAHAGGYAPKPDKTVFILLIGSDSGAPRYGRGGSQETGRADSVHILALNPKRPGATLVGFPRDSYVEIPGSGRNKINAALVFGGPKLLVEAVERVAGVQMDYYMLTNFEDFIQMVGEFDRGLTIRVPYPMFDVDSSTDFGPGIRRLDPGRVLGYARNRHSAPDGDFGRSRNQGTILQTAQAKAREKVGANGLEVLNFVRIIRRHVATDLPLLESLRLGLLALSIKPENIRNEVLPGTTGNAGGASVVFLTARATEILRDLADDGLLSR